MCLTCGARARSVVMMEALRTQHGRAAKGRVIGDVDGVWRGGMTLGVAMT